jgi:hypothetical protein
MKKSLLSIIALALFATLGSAQAMPLPTGVNDDCHTFYMPAGSLTVPAGGGRLVIQDNVVNNDPWMVALMDGYPSGINLPASISSVREAIGNVTPQLINRTYNVSLHRNDGIVVVNLINPAIPGQVQDLTGPGKPYKMVMCVRF